MPEGWAWCRLGNTVKDIADIDHKMPEIKEEGIPFISPIDFTKDGKIDFQNAKKISKSDFERLSQKIKPSVNDIIFPRYGTIGVLRLVNSDLDFLVSYSCATIVTDKVYSNPKYIYYALQTSLAQSEINKYKVTTTQSNIGIKSLKQFFIPLAPLAEQQCIVSSIESIFAQIDMLEQNKSNLETAIKQAKSKILDLAIHGKLVPQDPNDESAEELLKRIATSDNRPYEKVEEEPFEIPSNWCWCYLHTISTLLNGDRGENYPSKKDYVERGIPFINAGCLDNGYINYNIANYITEEKYNSLRAGKIKKGDVLYCLRGSLGKTGFVVTDNKGAISSSLCIFRLTETIIPQYFLYVLNSNAIKVQQKMVDNGTAQPNLSAKDVSNYLIAIPPLSEQKRIVSKIDELFSNLDQIQNNLI